jgi:hypothetical protein
MGLVQLCFFVYKKASNNEPLQNAIFSKRSESDYNGSGMVPVRARAFDVYRGL